MSKRAEEAAVRIAYQRKEFKYKDSHYQDGLYDGAIEGYEQAEEELALTWKDIREIDELLTLVYDPNSEESYYTRVLEEFKKWREGR